MSLARQLSPFNTKWLIAAITNALKEPHSYIYFNFSQQAPDAARIMSRFLPTEPKPIISYWKNNT